MRKEHRTTITSLERIFAPDSAKSELLSYLKNEPSLGSILGCKSSYSIKSQFKSFKPYSIRAPSNFQRTKFALTAMKVSVSMSVSAHSNLSDLHATIAAIATSSY
jgi:hypothetical protein